MTHLKLTLYSLVLCIFFSLLLPCKSYGQLSGSYTINPSGSASSTNYLNWASAVGDLLSGSRTDGGSAQGPGVNAAVTFTVTDNVYNNTAIELTAITGSSYTNTITFKSAGGDSTKCRLSNASSSSSTNDYVLSINGADYVTFQEIGFERTGTNTYCNVVVINSDADKNRLIRCFLKGKKQPSSSTLGFAYGPGSIIYFLGNADSTEITQNEIMYGYNGIFNTTNCTANTISGNRIDTSGSSGIYMTGQNSLRILGNSFNMGDFGAGKGHYTSYGFRIESSPSMIAANNKVIMSAVNGQVVRAIVLAGVNTPSTSPTAMVYNNSVVNSGGTTECTGFAVYGTYYMEIAYNNVLILNSLTNASGYYHYAAYSNGNISILNNNFINKGGGYAINVPGSNTADLDTLDYNNLYTNGNYIGNWNATNYSTFSAWQSGTSRDANSMNYDPGYASNSNLHVSNIKLNGKALYDSRIRTDFDGDSRDNSTPDIGADEFFPATLDAGVANLDSPMLFSAGKQNVKVSFQNYGFDTIKKVEIYWQINGSSQSPYSWSGTLAPGASSSSVIGNFTFSANTTYKFKIWTRDPNGKSDQKNINDTLTITRMPAMAGKYTIGDTSVADYKSFNQAITAITSRGISGAITFDVFKGTYNEQITLVGLPGMGSSNPIKFQNITNDSTKVVITLASTVATGSNNAALQLRGASYITFKGITFERTGTTTNIGHVIHILNGAHHNTFTNCRMIGLMNGTTQGYNIWSDGSKDDYNTFRNNRIQFGNTNMQYLSSTGANEKGTVIEGNIFEGGMNNSVVIQFNDSITVKGNKFIGINNHIPGNFDIQLSDCDKAINVNGNFFNSNNTDTSLWLVGCNAASGSYGIVANNAITKNYGKAILLDGVDYQNVVYNSIYFNSGATTNSAINTSAATSSNIVMKNNNIVMDGGIAFNINTGSQVSASDNNNLFIKGGQFAYWGASYNTLSSMVSGTGMDLKTLSIDPLFIVGSNLHIKNYLLKGKGTPVSGVTTDFDGETRHSTTPDIGADEFILVPNDAGMTALYKPIVSTCAGVLDVEAVIKNFGNDNLKSATITWTVNGVSQTPYTWTGDLKTNALDTVLLGSYNFSTAFNPRFTLRTYLPNGQSDGIAFNDSIIVTRALRALPNANAGADMIICTGDSVTLGSTPATGHSYKWMSISGSTLSTKSQITVKPTATTKYVLEVTNTSFGCTRNDTIEISLNTKPLANAGIDKTICPGSNVQLGAAPQSGFTYSWTSIPGGFTSSSANPTDIPSFTTTYILEKTVSGSGCKDLDTVVITVDVIPFPKIQGKDNLCQKEKQNYFTTKNSGNTYKWIVSGGTIVSGQNTNSIIIDWVATGINLLQVVETNSASCFDTTDFYVIVNQNPKADFIFKGTCLTEISTFTNLSTNAQNYAWTFGDGITSTQKDPLHTYATAISYNVRLIAKSSFCNDTVTKLVPIEPLPVPNFTTVQKPNNTLDFSNTSTITTGSIVSWHWRFGDGDTSILQNPTHKYPSSANYTVTLCVKSLPGCESCTTKDISFAGVKGVGIDPALYIYPNPGRGLFKIHASKQLVSVNILNTLGQVVQIGYPLDNEFIFNLTEQPCGVYFVKVEMGSLTQVVRIIKE
ncbi:MAG: PKD domain-containing protein [Bacteroidia bacterium]